jgi:hypothetical protein
MDAHDLLGKLVGMDLALDFFKLGIGYLPGSFFGLLGHADRLAVKTGLRGDAARDLVLLAVRGAVAKHPVWRARMFSNRCHLQRSYNTPLLPRPSPMKKNVVIQHQWQQWQEITPARVRFPPPAFL